jgi:hypothetical protein
MKPDVESGTGNFQNPTHRSDRPDITVIVDEAVL